MRAVVHDRYGPPYLIYEALIDAGKYRAVIDRRYPIEQVIDAARYVETRQKTGNFVLTMQGSA
jgi:hypothetical protein